MTGAKRIEVMYILVLRALESRESVWIVASTELEKIGV